MASTSGREGAKKGSEEALEEEDYAIENEQSRLRWRDDPNETFSDWTVEIVCEDEGPPGTKRRKVEGGSSSSSSRTFHVHKYILAYGDRRSEYFARLFGGNFNEGQSQRSLIQLHPLAAEAFPAFLDYVYGQDLSISTPTAAPLLHLAEYFQVKRLRSAVVNFFHGEKTRKDNSWAIYKKHAEIFSSPQVVLDTVKRLMKGGMKRHVLSLEHASRCGGAARCTSQNCAKMKGYIDHQRLCQIKDLADCTICRSVGLLQQLHAKRRHVASACCICKTMTEVAIRRQANNNNSD